eukprot:6183591-Pleurochrysis_carterae.AAC.1
MGAPSLSHPPSSPSPPSNQRLRCFERLGYLHLLPLSTPTASTASTIFTTSTDQNSTAVMVGS